MKNKQLNFNGQNIYVGIDTHKKSWRVAIVVNGLLVKRLSMDPEPKKLQTYLEKNFPDGKYYSVYEAGFSGFWPQRQLTELGTESKVVNPADVPTKGKEKIRKTDKVDAKKLARQLSAGTLEGIYIPDKKAEAFRTLVRLRKQLTGDQTRVKNRIKSLLMFLGEKVPEDINTRNWSNIYIRALKELPIEEEVSKKTLDELIKTLESLRTQLARIIKYLREYVKNDPESKKIVNLLMSVPGVGFTVGVILYSEIIDIKRFRRLEQLVAYVGLAPSVYSSGEKEKVLGLSKQRNRYLRNYLIQSSWAAIRKDPVLLATYGELIKRISKSKAILRISKKLLSRIKHVWSTEEPYVIGVVE